MIQFFVAGKPISQGSMRSIPNKHTGKPVMIADNSAELRQWRRAVKEAAKDAGVRKTQDPVSIVLDFLMPAKSKSHDVGRVWHTVTPDVDKLERAILDALTGVAYVDDAQVCLVQKRKRWAGTATPGVKITIDTLKGAR